MSNQQYQNKKKEENKGRVHRASAVEHESHRQKQCPRCGTAYDEGDLFCPECGESLTARHCPHCGSQLEKMSELCPYCGRPIDTAHCSFCGSLFEGDEPFCGECGSPRMGIKCPKCGSLSFRSFCSHCNTPLNDNATQALAIAQADPKFKRACRLNQEMAEIEAYLYDLKAEIEQAMAEEEEEANAPDAPQISAEGEKLRSQYAELMKLLGQQPAAAPQRQERASNTQTQAERKRQLRIKYFNADSIMAAYREKAAEMQQVLQSMLPDVGMTPQMQRDFACARKVPIITLEKGTHQAFWVCNYCGCYHLQPSECVEEWRGGTWVTEEVTVETKIWGYLK